MAGLYIHIPFCKQACHYCNFHFSTTRHLQQPLVDALVNELKLQKDFLPSTQLSSIYFGGGTPSLLTESQLYQIFEAISRHYTWSDDAEITLEANPDDLNEATLSRLGQSPINRLSIGTQSFQQHDLALMNRAHTVDEALRSIIKAKEAGFEAINIDLIYGMPGASLPDWQHNVDTFLSLDLPHLSSYCLTVEPKTALAHQVTKGAITLPEDETIAAQYEYLHKQLEAAGYVHYEISNFAKPGHLAHHNTSYWKSHPYLGIGPSAHSFKAGLRQWNIAHNKKYIDAIAHGTILCEQEQIDKKTAFNEYLLTGLRTYWGIDLAWIADYFGHNVFTQLQQDLQPHLSGGELIQDGEKVHFDPMAWLISDGIISDLFQ